MNPLLQQRRRERRRPAAGQVILWVDDPAPLEIRGRLVDTSPSGFRAEHDCATLATGVQVRFQHGQKKGKARVMWNRIQGGGVESGFLVVG